MFAQFHPVLGMESTWLTANIGDGLRHYGYQKEAKFYNGVTLEDIHGPNATNINGIGGMS
jgi:hypothetical protein